MEGVAVGGLFAPTHAGREARTGFAFKAQIAQPRPAGTPGADADTTFVREQRHDDSARYTLRCDWTGLRACALSGCQQIMDVFLDPAIPQAQLPKVPPSTCTPWLSNLKILTDVLANFINHSGSIAAVSRIPNFLGHQLCPPLRSCEDLGYTMWIILCCEDTYGIVGNMLTDVPTQGSLQEDREFYRDTTDAMPFENQTGLLTHCGAAGIDCARADLPVKPPAAPRSSDIAGVIDWLTETLHSGFARIVRTLSSHRAHEKRSTSWTTARGGYGGEGSEAVNRSVAYNLNDYAESMDGFSHRPAVDVVNPHREPTPLPGEGRPAEVPDSRDGVEPNAAGFHCDPRDVLSGDDLHTRLSAMAAGNWTRSVLSPQGWTSIAQEDFGLALIHAAGPDGKLAKWFSVFSDSSCCMTGRSGTAGNTPFDFVDEMNSHERRISVGREAHPDLVALLVPYLHQSKYEIGATMETLAAWIRDEILLWALPYHNYLMYWRSMDIPVGQGLPSLPEAWDENPPAGRPAWDTDIGPCASLQDARAALERERIALRVASAGPTRHQFACSPDFLTKIREHNAALAANDMVKARELDQQILDFWSNEFPAWLKQKHYQRGLMAIAWYSGSDLAPANRGQHWYDPFRHAVRAPVQGRDRWINCLSDGTLETIPAHVHIDAARLRDVLNYWRAPTILGPGKSHQWGLTAKFDEQAKLLLQPFTGKGIMVMPRTAWVDQLEIDGWRAQLNNHSRVQLALEITRAAQLRALLAVPQSLQSQDIPFRHPVIIPVSEDQGLAQASELQTGHRVHEEQILHFRRLKGLQAIQHGTAEHTRSMLWMSSVVRSVNEGTSPAAPPFETPAPHDPAGRDTRIPTTPIDMRREPQQDEDEDVAAHSQRDPSAQGLALTIDNERACHDSYQIMQKRFSDLMVDHADV